MSNQDYCEGCCPMLDQKDLLQNEELYYDCGELINDNVLTIREEIVKLKRYFASKRREVNEEIRNDYSVESGQDILKETLKFYEQVFAELEKVEFTCDEYRLGMKHDLLKEAEARLEIPTDIKAIGKSGKGCHTKGHEYFPELKPLDANCRCTWKPIPSWILEDTRDIILKVKADPPTAFDESDLKFKQELTVLRSKIFSLPKSEVRAYNENLVKKTGDSKNHRNSTSTQESLDIFWVNTKFNDSVPGSELKRMGDLKFLDGVFLEPIGWPKLLDSRTDQLRSKWQLVLQTQIESLIRKRRVPKLHLDARRTFDLLIKIPENGFNFELSRDDLMRLLRDKVEVFWLRSWKLQIKTTKGPHIAATLIQSRWRGYSLRKKMWKSQRLYIAASVMWFAWIVLKENRKLHDKYLKKMLESMHATEEASLILSRNFSTLIETPHVVIHLPSLGYPSEIRRGVDKQEFCMDENASFLRLSFLRNPMSYVIYVLPVMPTKDLLEMYNDLIEFVAVNDDAARRISFVSLSEANTFKKRPLNLSRILHCSSLSLEEIRSKIDGKLAYILPWVVDECDVRLAGDLGIALLSPSMELQQNLLNPSRLAEIIEKFGLPQPVHTRNIRDYEKLCNSMADLIVKNTEITCWLIRLNCGPEKNHCAVFFVNHISIPFMPLLRKERETFGEKWNRISKLRASYLFEVKEQLWKVVATLTKLPHYYDSWKEFYAHVVRFGCLLQAVPVDKKSSFVSVGLFLPGIHSGKKPEWTGTADELNLGSQTFSSYAYMIPQTSVKTSKLAPTVNKFADAIHREGYLGFLTVTCYCYPHKYEDKLFVAIIDVHPYYSHAQSYIDWMKFAINGDYDPTTNTFTGNIDKTGSPKKRRESPFLLIERTPEWDETPLRYAIFVPNMQHTRFNNFSWSELRNILEKQYKITYDSKKKEGCHVMLLDSEIKENAMMVNIGTTMSVTIQVTVDNVKRLHHALSTKTKQNVSTNLPNIADFFLKLSYYYVDVSADPCAGYAQ